MIIACCVAQRQHGQHNSAKIASKWPNGPKIFLFTYICPDVINHIMLSINKSSITKKAAAQSYKAKVCDGTDARFEYYSLANKFITMFNNRTKIKKILAGEFTGREIIVMGWVRTFRNNQFIAVNDGSTNNNLQVVVELGLLDELTLRRITTGASLKVTGIVTESLGKGQKVELKASEIAILGDSDAEKYPLQPKKHSLEFLREVAHLRFRTNTFGAVFRVRHSLAFAIHKFFNEKGFVYLHSPDITASDAEVAG